MEVQNVLTPNVFFFLTFTTHIDLCNVLFESTLFFVDNIAKDCVLSSHLSAIYHSNDDNKKIRFDRKEKPRTTDAMKRKKG